MFTAARFTIAKTWKPPKCPLTDEWIKKMWYVYTMEYYSAIKNEIASFAATWMDLEIIILSEVSHEEKDKYHMISLIRGIENMIQMNLQNRNRLTDREHTCGCEGGGVGGMDWEFGVSRCKLLHLEWINIKVLWYSTGNYIQYLVINHNGKEKKDTS